MYIIETHILWPDLEVNNSTHKVSENMGHFLKKLGYFPYYSVRQENMNLNELPWNREQEKISTNLPFQNNNKTQSAKQDRICL